MLEPKIYQHPKLITVFGGSGFVGRHIVEALTKRGYRVRIAVRHPEKAYYMQQIGDVGQTQMVKANVSNAASVARALFGADAAIFLPGLMFNEGKNTFQKVQLQGAENVAKLAAKANIELVHMSALFNDEHDNSEHDHSGQGKTAYMKTKMQAEERVKDLHARAIIMRPSLIFGPEDSFFNRFANWARFTPLLPLFGGGHTKFQPVYVGDVAEMVARAIDGKLLYGTTYELGGREEFSFRDLMEEMLRVIRRRRGFIKIPLSLGILGGAVCGLLGKIPFVPVLATAGQMRMLKYNSVVSDAAQQENRTLEGVGITPRSMDVVLPSYLWRFRVHGQFSRALN